MAAQMRKLDGATNSSVAIAITSIHTRLMRHQLHDPSARGFILNQRVPIPLRAYYSAFDDAVKKFALPLMPNVTWLNLTERQPWHHAYLIANLSNTSTTQRAYAAHQFGECIVRTPPSVAVDKLLKARDCREGRCADGICRDVRLIIKIAAFYDAVTTVRDATFVLWLDADAYFQRAPDDSFFSWMRHFDAATIFRNVPPSTALPETGIVCFQTTRAARLLVKAMRAAYYHYNTPSFKGLRGLNDVHLARFFLHTPPPSYVLLPRQPKHYNNTTPLPKGHRLTPGLRVGRFGVACRPPTTAPNLSAWVWASRAYENEAGPFDCPSGPVMEAWNAQNARRRLQTPQALRWPPVVSPFNLFEYVTHCKGSGPTTQAPGGGGANARRAHRC